MAEHFQHARRQLALAIVTRGVAHHALVFGELLVELEGIVPLEVAGHDVSPRMR
ncbi:hypothetical protein D3C71_1952050 [compost metagenome]